MKDTAILKTGIAGSVIAAICRFTPFPVVLGAGGLSRWSDLVDNVLLPALVRFPALAAHGPWTRRVRGRVLRT